MKQNNDIPKQLLDKWQREAQSLCDARFDRNLVVSKVEYDFYIQGCKSTYLSMQAEIEAKDDRINLIMTLLEIRFKLSCPVTSFNLQEAVIGDEEQWQQFKLKHNI